MSQLVFLQSDESDEWLDINDVQYKHFLDFMEIVFRDESKIIEGDEFKYRGNTCRFYANRDGYYYKNINTGKIRSVIIFKLPNHNGANFDFQKLKHY